MTDFETLGRLCRTDKVTHHGYHRYYPLFLDHLRMKKFSMVEIGIEQGHSVPLWKSYFPYAFVWGLDKDVSHKDERCFIYKGDQSSVSDLTTLSNLIKEQHTNFPLSFVIDDGSHIPEHQTLTFNTLFPQMVEGGVYIIEDVETSYWTKHQVYGYPTRYGYKHKDSITERCKGLVDDINHEFLSNDNRALTDIENRWILPKVKKLIATMTFGRNCIIFTKKTQSELDEYERVYRFQACL